MRISGGTVAGVARATSPIRENDSSRPWREVLHFIPSEDKAQIIASDGFVVVRATVPQPAEATGYLRRRDAERFSKEDSLDVETAGDEDRISVENSGVDIRLEQAFSDKDEEAYPDGPAKALAANPRGRPAFRCDPRILRRVMYAFIEAGVEHVEVFVAPKIGDGMIFFSGLDEGDVLVEAVLGFPKNSERKSKTGEIVETMEPTPLFPGAEAPAEPDTAEPPPQD